MSVLIGKALHRCEQSERASHIFGYGTTHPLRPKRGHTKAKLVDNALNRCPTHLLCRIKGSVFPKALIVSLPSVFVVVALRYLIESNDWDIPDVGGNEIWSGYNGALAFLLIFRTQKAYARWWEGGTLLQQVRGEWYTAASSLVAFCTSDAQKFGEVRDFQHLMVRLMSLLYCSALQQVAMLDDDCFEILSTEGLDNSSLEYLHSSSNRCEVLIQWLQKLIIDSMNKRIIIVEAPIVSRVFQELSRGFVNLNNVRKIREFPFPFPYAQMITLMLLVHWLIMPIASCLLVENAVWASILTFLTIFAFWCINFIAEEIEMPFGDDSNDLPIAYMQKQMNASLFTLLQKGCQKPPCFSYRSSASARTMSQSGASMPGSGSAITDTTSRSPRGWKNHWPDAPPCTRTFSGISFALAHQTSELDTTDVDHSFSSPRSTPRGESTKILASSKTHAEPNGNGDSRIILQKGSVSFTNLPNLPEQVGVAIDMKTVKDPGEVVELSGTWENLAREPTREPTDTVQQPLVPLASIEDIEVEERSPRERQVYKTKKPGTCGRIALGLETCSLLPRDDSGNCRRYIRI